ncbi:acetyl-CoA carboxylase carboxyltransferase subunit alpha [Verrucosispora sp. WMMD1129]|uniref:acetyl-CoA carboxylase carboxyltransferase subunit alpha n=1 Tax=Verrucosispora sp. WMMD1129 TaxID=3016093 RepID=UPI00249CE59B|nr:acetyl-CoA carboxylase carboxyltransferase subunit alpha [Verrucosispora sp. WMMD1129]WFE43432.1 acetyl-CoA carboxylase carboxyltransferase subunit alpha [Verrucosispora sp. WMMD1129]
MTATAPSGESLWSRCGGCAALLYRKRLRRNLDVCPECGLHTRLAAPERVSQLVDPGSFRPLPDRAVEVDPIGFVDVLPYPHRLAAARADTGLAEAVLCGTATIGGSRCALAVMDFRFLGGSLGCAVGELITRTAEQALELDIALVLVTASGGARMQEGALSLMQMATVSQAMAALREVGLLTVSVLTDPTYGGVAASFATSADLVLAESGTRMGFAGPRVIRQVTGRTLPEGFQTAEFLLRHGQIDMVVPRHALRVRLATLLAATCRRATNRPGATAPPPEAARPTPASRAPARDAWETVRLARHPGRPTTLDYLETTFDGFTELHGDRLGGDCPAVVGGVARLDGRHLMVIGHQKGHTTAELAARNFGMATPAGHRKALRLMRLAARLGLPVVTLVDTPGADPGVEAEEHGQAAAIAENILTLSVLPTPVVTVVTGEGGSGGALALAVADRVLMLQHAVYSVISPEGCAAILWPGRTAAPQAARALRLTAPDLCRLGVVDEVVPEPDGSAANDPEATARAVRQALLANLLPLLEVPTVTLVQRRRRRFRRFGAARAGARAGAR